MHIGRGKIIYDPPRPGMKRRTKWWSILRVDREITRYYRWWIKKEMNIELCKPSWDAHISIVRGEEPRPHLLNLWNKYDGKYIEFRYSHIPRRSGDTTGFDRPDFYWFLDVECEFLDMMRNELKLPTKWKYHLTFGRTY